jgi:hypothetical protein
MPAPLWRSLSPRCSRGFPNTSASIQALFRGKERLGPSRREREDEAILAFAERVCARVEPHLEDCLTAELLWFFLGVGGPPTGPQGQVQALGG